MTRDEIFRLAGRELDEAVHKHVFGRRVVHATEKVSISGGEWLPRRKVPADPETKTPIPHYSSDWNDAWDVVEAMTRRGYRFEIDELTVATYPYRGVTDTILCFYRNTGERVYNRYAYTGHVPVAICRAALLAVCGEKVSND